MTPQTDEPWFYIEPEDDEPGPGEDEQVNACASLVSKLEQDQNARISALLRLASIYTNRDQAQGYNGGVVIQNSRHQASMLNLTAVGLDTLVARLIDNECHVTFNVDDADYGLQERARLQEAFVRGEMYRLEMYRHLEQVARDGGWAGDGWLNIFERDGRVDAERVNPIEMYLDLQSTLSGPPRELYRIRHITKAYAKMRWPDLADVIEDLPITHPPYAHVHTDKLVKLVEAYHLPDRDMGPDSTGWQLIFCGNQLIKRTEWKRETFPYVRFCWAPDPAGYSIGLIEQIGRLQLELNRVKARKSQALQLLAVPRYWMQQGGSYTPEMDNRVGWVYKFRGAKPELDNNPVVPPDLWNEEQRLQQAILLQCGISPFDAQQESPSRMDSRPGLREYSQLASRRHALVSKNWERLHLDCAKQIVTVAKEIAEAHGSYKTIGRDREFVEEIDWKDANLEADRFHMQLAPTNLLPNDPAGKRLAVGDLAQANAFQGRPELLWQMLTGNPDTDRFVNRVMAGQKLIEKQMYMITSRGEYMPPDEHQDLEACKTASQETYWLIAAKSPRTAKDKRKWEQVLGNLTRYREEAEAALLRMQQAQAAQLAMAQQALPPGPPGPPGPPSQVQPLPPQGVTPGNPSQPLPAGT